MTEKSPTQTPTRTPDEIVALVAELLETDLNTTLAIMAGVCSGIRDNSSTDTLRQAKAGSDALRIELGKWRKALMDAAPEDATAALLAAGAKAMSKSAG